MCDRDVAWVIMAEGGCDSRTGESNDWEERVKEGMEWEARAKSLIRNSGG